MTKKLMLLSVAALTMTGLALAAGTAATTTIRTALERPTMPDQTRDVLIYGYDFEDGWDVWSSVDAFAQTSEWHTSDWEAWEGDSWWSGNEDLGGYDNHWLHFLVSPELDISGATSPQLTFKLNYTTEAPGGEPVGYDAWDACNVWYSTDGGDNWAPIPDVSPAYDSNSCYSFGYEFGMGTGIPGWTDSSGGWVDASIDLTDYISDQFMFRFAFCSDPAYSTADNPNIWGMVVDDVVLADGGTTYLENDADGTADPSDFTLDVYSESAGDFWEITDESSHSGDFSAHLEDGLFNLGDALVSPWITLPADNTIWFQYWIYCDMLDSDGDGDNTLEDYYHVQITSDGMIWNNLFYDYTREGAGMGGWNPYIPGTPFNGNIDMDLSSYAGGDIRIRFLVSTDDNNDGGVGNGIYIDDFEVWGTDMLPHDFATTLMAVPYPRAANWTSPVFMEFTNFGSSEESNVTAFMFANGVNLGPVQPPLNLAPLESASRTKDWTPATTGLYDLNAFTMLATDQDHSNDTAYVYDVTILPEGDLQFSYLYGIGDPLYYFHTDVGTGWGVKATLEDDGLEGDFTIDNIKVYWYNNSPNNTPVNVYIYADDGGIPGTELYNHTFNVTTGQLYPNACNFTIPDVVVGGSCWVWLELTTDDGSGNGLPEIMGNDFIWNGEHYFRWDGSGVPDFSYNEPQAYEFCIWVGGTASEAVIDTPVPGEFVLAQNYPNPFNPTTTISFSTAFAQSVTLTVYNIAGQAVNTLYDGISTGGVQNITFNASDLASGVYFYRLETPDNVATCKMVLAK
ncbi:MAG: T9SS type A sorting domain-containing protein [Candidatus Delongbacteria bacterium]|nr:T9SS type A sorting domain-containing protein [Candidatus Delongbacteria bacterium]